MGLAVSTFYWEVKLKKLFIQQHYESLNLVLWKVSVNMYVYVYSVDTILSYLMLEKQTVTEEAV